MANIIQLTEAAWSKAVTACRIVVRKNTFFLPNLVVTQRTETNSDLENIVSILDTLDIALHYFPLCLFPFDWDFDFVATNVCGKHFLLITRQVISALL